MHIPIILCTFALDFKNKQQTIMNVTFYREDINRIFKENNLSYDSFINNNNGMIEITIENGDWKHDHARLNYLMRKNHYRFITEKEIGISEDDSYSSIHCFKYGI